MRSLGGISQSTGASSDRIASTSDSRSRSATNSSCPTCHGSIESGARLDVGNDLGTGEIGPLRRVGRDEVDRWCELVAARDERLEGRLRVAAPQQISDGDHPVPRDEAYLVLVVGSDEPVRCADAHAEHAPERLHRDAERLRRARGARELACPHERELGAIGHRRRRHARPGHRRLSQMWGHGPLSATRVAHPIAQRGVTGSGVRAGSTPPRLPGRPHPRAPSSRARAARAFRAGGHAARRPRS